MSATGPDEYDRLAEHSERAREGNLAKGAEKLAEQHKLFVRDRLRACSTTARSSKTAYWRTRLRVNFQPMGS